jgi:hypothetical protein
MSWDLKHNLSPVQTPRALLIAPPTFGTLRLASRGVWSLGRVDREVCKESIPIWVRIWKIRHKDMPWTGRAARG